ncbi:MAG: BBE domain-containing protein, partial [Acidobacteriota bacterium]
RDFVSVAPDDLAVWVVLRKAPPLPFLAPEVHGTEVLVLAVFYAGDMEKGKKLVEPLRGFEDPLAFAVTPHQYTAFQSAFDPLLTPGARNYWKSHDLSELSDGAIDTVLEYAGKLPSPHCETFLGHLGGAMGRVPPDQTAYPHRDANFVMNVHSRWERPGQDQECIGWARDCFRAVEPFSTGGVYVNFLTQDEQERVRMAYKGNYERLVRLKKKYDPDNFFRMNHNIV